jgi:hypothetical protein
MPNGRIGRTGLAATPMAKLWTSVAAECAGTLRRIGRLRKWGLSPALARPIGSGGEFRQPMSGGRRPASVSRRARESE